METICGGTDGWSSFACWQVACQHFRLLSYREQQLRILIRTQKVLLCRFWYAFTGLESFTYRTQKKKKRKPIGCINMIGLGKKNTCLMQGDSLAWLPLIPSYKWRQSKLSKANQKNPVYQTISCSCEACWAHIKRVIQDVLMERKRECVLFPLPRK